MLFLLRMKIGTTFLALLLSATILLSSFRVALTYAHLYLDPVGFIEMLCENQDKPEMQCNGKCHLKKIAVESMPNDKAPANKIELKELLLFVQQNKKLSFVTFTKKKTTIFYHSDLYNNSVLDRLDRPPQV